MSDLLTLDEYQAIADNFDLRQDALIDGRFQPGKGALLDSINPAIGNCVASIAVASIAVTVNCFGEGDTTTPYGGYKQSGFGGRDNSMHASDQYTGPKTTWIDLSDKASAESIG